MTKATYANPSEGDIIRMLVDLVSWADQLKCDRYTGKQLGGVELADYYQLLETIAAAKRLIVKLRFEQEGVKNAI